MRVQGQLLWLANRDGAVRDDELSLALSLLLTHETIVKVVANPEDVPGVQ